MKYIELFAGCGGMSLGLESAGFELFFANELSPMAAETFSFNLLGEDLDKLAKEGCEPKKTIWIRSRFDRADLRSRLDENPLSLTKYRGMRSDLTTTIEPLENKMLVGDVKCLNRHFLKNPSLVKNLRGLNLDLVSGGPPCQSFSLAGLRQHDNKRNSLPMDFADFVGHAKPKMAILENVSGILRAFTLEDGSKHFAWFEVARAFSDKGYVPLCLHVNAKNVGAAQNRPRFIMLAFREDVFTKIKSAPMSDALKEALQSSSSFHKKEERYKKGRDAEPRPEIDLKYFEISKHPELFSDFFLEALNSFPSAKVWNTAKNAIDDLRKKSYSPDNYAMFLGKVLPPIAGSAAHEPYERDFNHNRRNNSNRVRKRFRLYQLISRAPKGIKRDVITFLGSPSKHKMTSESYDFLLGKNYLDDDKSLISLPNKHSLNKYLESLATKKHSQRALRAAEPAPATLSIPDDVCHYHLRETRTLTVREMARLQSFPDWFIFRSKETTGGQMRKFQVPQYTQAGNAVPPLLGLALGKVVARFLGKTNSSITDKDHR